MLLVIIIILIIYNCFFFFFSYNCQSLRLHVLPDKDQEPENMYFKKICLMLNRQKCGKIQRDILYNSGLCSMSINVA